LGRRPLGTVLHSSNEPGELSQWLCHDDSTINIVLVIIIIIIIIDALIAAGSQLNKNLVGEINEYFLFHGTKQNGLKSIEDHGLDSRLSTNAMFGNGVYFAESFTKADQYAGNF